MDMMYHSLQNLFLLEEEAEAVSTQANSPLAEFIFFGLSAVIPLIDFKSLPTVSHSTVFYLLHLFRIRTLHILSRSHNNSSPSLTNYKALDYVTASLFVNYFV